MEICKHCGQELNAEGWSNTTGDLHPNIWNGPEEDEPYWNTCPGSVERLALYPTFGLYFAAGFDLYDDHDNHEPMDPLAYMLYQSGRGITP